MRASNFIFATLALLVISGCSQEFTLPLPERQNDPGYAGDWRGTVLGQQMILRVDPFDEGAETSPGRLLYANDTIDWPVLCRLLPDGEGSLNLDCTLTIGAEPPFCAVPAGDLPRIEITESVPRVRLVIEISGTLREGTDAECDGPVIVDWGVGGNYTFTPA